MHKMLPGIIFILDVSKFTSFNFIKFVRKKKRICIVITYINLTFSTMMRPWCLISLANGTVLQILHIRSFLLKIDKLLDMK